MLDIRLLREKPDLVKQGIAKKGHSASLVDEILALDTDRRAQLTQVEDLRAQQKRLDYKTSQGMEEAKLLKEKLSVLEDTLRNTEDRVHELSLELPNLPASDVPVGDGESANRVIKTVGEIPSITTPLDHVAIAEKYDLLDSERGVKVAESRFNFLKNEMVLLEFALIRFALDVIMKHGFVPMITPQLVNQDVATGTGYVRLNEDLNSGEVYKTQDDLYLIGTSEMAIVAYHKNEIIDLSDGPKRYVGFSTCFRREAGSYGKDMKGMFRTHQFDKVEMVSFVKPEDSVAELERILAIEEEIMQTLGLPYHILEIGTGDLGVQASQKYDVEAWLPGQQKYRETHSCSNTTDFQARRLNVRYKDDEGKNHFVHILNGTGIAMSRMPIAILENGQQSDGSISIPTALVPYCGFSQIG